MGLSQGERAFQASRVGNRQGCQRGRSQVAAGFHHMRRAFQAQVGQDEMGTQDTAGSPAATHLTHRNPFSSRYRSGSSRASQACAGVLRAGERERRCSARGSPQKDVTWREQSAAAGSGLQRDFCSKEAAGGPACGCAGPTWHCSPEAGAEKAHSVLGDTVCLRRTASGTEMVDRTASRGVKGMGETRLSEAGRAE